LLFTIDQKDFSKVKNHPDITVIGHIVEQKEGLILITKQENIIPITAQGWKHF
jgi:thiamine-monophosphate kinase